MRGEDGVVVVVVVAVVTEAIGWSSFVSAGSARLARRGGLTLAAYTSGMYKGVGAGCDPSWR